MDFKAQLNAMRSGFTRTFWVANVIELFERFAYYGSKAILTVYVAEQVGLGPESAGWLVGSVFNTLLYFLPILAGTVVDRYGFKRSLQICFAIFCVGYFLIGLAGLPQGQGLVQALGARNYMIVALVITAIGGSLIKPSVVGTVARTTNDNTKALGYSIYYTLVNLGGAVGPMLALLVRENLGISYVLVMSSLTSLALLIGTTIFFDEPARPSEAGEATSMARVLADMVVVFFNVRFMLFLVIFSGFWMMFWQIFYSFPFYVRDVLKFAQFEIMETVDAWTIIVVTVPVAALVKHLKAMRAMTIGFALATACWFLMAAVPGSVPVAVAAIVLFALGEAIQAPRYYEYVADLAPKDQVGTYMGFAFLPVAIGTFIAGALGGRLVAQYIQGPGAAAPERMWLVVASIGVVATVLMLVYDAVSARLPGGPPLEAIERLPIPAREAARGFRSMNLAALGQVLMALTLFLGYRGSVALGDGVAGTALGLLAALAVLFGFGLLLGGAGSAVLLARPLGSMAWIVGLVMLVPGVNLLLVVILRSQAEAFWRKHGLQGGALVPTPAGGSGA